MASNSIRLVPASQKNRVMGSCSPEANVRGKNYDSVGINKGQLFVPSCRVRSKRRASQFALNPGSCFLPPHRPQKLNKLSKYIKNRKQATNKAWKICTSLPRLFHEISGVEENPSEQTRGLEINSERP